MVGWGYSGQGGVAGKEASIHEDIRDRLEEVSRGDGPYVLGKKVRGKAAI